MKENDVAIVQQTALEKMPGVHPRYITDNGKYILDCYFERIDNPAQAEVEINNLPGVVENGLFINRVEQAIIATQDGIHIQC